MQLYDTLTGQKRDFSPAGPEVKLYVCGVTPYLPCHLGHAMSYIIFDVLRRYLEFLGYRVRHVQNFTDIDDKIIERAARLNIPPRELAERYIEEYLEDMDALGVKRAAIYPRATQEMPAIVEMVRGLVDKGYAYQAGGDVYFRVRRWPDYGKLSHRIPESLMAGARVEPVEGKEDPLDFALWKAAKEGEPSWDSPWGAGRPGWHAECSAMSLKYLGQPVDIHGGGQDLIFPHHENEIAQSEAYTGATPFVRWWTHNGLLQLGEDKMSKSLGNLVTVREALFRYSADAIRLFVLSSHYHGPLTYSPEGLEGMERGAARLRRALQEDNAQTAHGGSPPLDSGQRRQRFIEAMDDDLNTPQAVAALFDLAREINRAREAGADVSQARGTLIELSDVLGLSLREGEGPSQMAAAPFVELLLEVRGGLRKAKEWALADLIRDRLSRLGVTVEDTPAGPRWSRQREAGETPGESKAGRE